MLLSRQSVVKVRAASSSSPMPPEFEAFQKRLESRRQALETARTMKIQRLQQDVERIVKREREYAKQLLDEIIPVKITFNDDAWQRLQEILPIRVEHTTAAAAAAAPEVRPATPEPAADTTTPAAAETAIVKA